MEKMASNERLLDSSAEEFVYKVRKDKVPGFFSEVAEAVPVVLEPVSKQQQGDLKENKGTLCQPVKEKKKKKRKQKYEWSEHKDQATGFIYYHNRLSSETTWDRPQDFPGNLIT
uniref:WW domain-containing protein n=1 Tax=Octactis speculum TaxID=3111310 RepID=A0A7S2G7Q1_9STRA